MNEAQAHNTPATSTVPGEGGARTSASPGWAQAMNEAQAMSDAPPGTMAIAPPLIAMRRQTVIDGETVTLYVDAVSLAALAAARAAGGSPASYGPLPDLDEVPLRLVALEARIEQLEGALYERDAA